MLAGHYAVGLGLKTFDRSIPLWFLFIVVELVDIFFMLFVLLDIEHMRITLGFTKTYPLDMYHFPVTHSLVMVPIWCLVGLFLYQLFSSSFTKKAIALVSIAIASHWFLDLIVHPPELPIFWDSIKVGFSLWNQPIISILLEISLVGGGLFLYLKSILKRENVNRTLIWVIGLILILLTIFMPYYPPPKSVSEAAIVGLILFFIIPIVAYFAEKPNETSQSATLKTKGLNE